MGFSAELRAPAANPGPAEKVIQNRNSSLQLLSQIAHTDSTFARVGAYLPSSLRQPVCSIILIIWDLSLSTKELHQPMEEPFRAPGNPERFSCSVGFQIKAHFSLSLRGGASFGKAKGKWALRLILSSFPLRPTSKFSSLEKGKEGREENGPLNYQNQGWEVPRTNSLHWAHELPHSCPISSSICSASRIYCNYFSPCVEKKSLLHFLIHWPTLLPQPYS